MKMEGRENVTVGWMHQKYDTHQAEIEETIKLFEFAAQK